MRTQREQRRRPAGRDPTTVPADLNRRPTGGQALPAAIQTHMGAAFGHDFSKVRVFADETAAVSAQSIGARAYTVGSDIYFNAHSFRPEDDDGRTLLAHELTHVVQQDRHAGAGHAALSDPADASEREASALAGRAAAGERVQVRATPIAGVSRGLLDWVEDKASGAASAVGDAASSVGSAVGGAASTVWDGTKSAASAVGGAVMDEAKSEYADMKTMGGWVKQGEEAVGHGIDWVEDKEKAATSWVADKAEGIPVLEQVVGAGKGFLDQQTELAGGIGRGVTGLVGGVAGMVANPVDTAKGLEAMAEHIPGIGGMGLKGAHGLLNVAMGDETWGQLGTSLGPEQSLKDDGQFWKSVGGGLVGQYSEQWKEGKYADVVGHAGFDIGSLFLGAGEANAAGKLGEASKLADAAKLGEAADAAKLGEAADVAKLGEGAKAEELAKAEEAAKAESALAAPEPEIPSAQAPPEPTSPAPPAAPEAPRAVSDNMYEISADALTDVNTGGRGNPANIMHHDNLNLSGVTDVTVAEYGDVLNARAQIEAGGGPPRYGGLPVGSAENGSMIPPMVGETTPVPLETRPASPNVGQPLDLQLRTHAETPALHDPANPNFNPDAYAANNPVTVINTDAPPAAGPARSFDPEVNQWGPRNAPDAHMPTGGRDRGPTGLGEIPGVPAGTGEYVPPRSGPEPGDYSLQSKPRSMEPLLDARGQPVLDAQGRPRQVGGPVQEVYGRPGDTLPGGMEEDLDAILDPSRY